MYINIDKEFSWREANETKRGGGGGEGGRWEGGREGGGVGRGVF